MRYLAGKQCRTDMGGTIRWLLLRPHSLLALGKAEALNSFRDQIRGRVVCLESALLLLVQSIGAQSVGDALQRLRGVNTRIDVLFGYKTEFVEEEIVRQLSSYLKDFREKLADDYLSEPPLSNA